MDYKREKFPLNHFVLHAKYWLMPIEDKARNDEGLYLNFLQKILYLDGYGSLEYKDPSYVVNVIVNRFSDYNDWLKQEFPGKYTSIAKFCGLVERYMLQYGFSQKMATIYVIKHLLSETSADEITLQPPTYNRKLFKMGIKSMTATPSTTYKELNDKAQKAFKEFKVRGLELEFIRFAKERAKQSQGTSYAWSYPTDPDDEKYFLSLFRGRLETQDWERMIDEWENEPPY